MLHRAIPRWAAAVLCEVVAGRGDVTAVRHPIGFICLPLERTVEHGVCVHLWIDRLVRARATTSTTHSHSWDLISFVLCGMLCNELIEVTDGPLGARWRVFEVGSGPDGDEIRRTARLVHTRTRAASCTAAVTCTPCRPACSTGRWRTARQRLSRSATGNPDATGLTLGDVDIATHRVRRHLCDRDETMHVASTVAERLAEVPQPRHGERHRERHREDRRESP
jgi:hypothetical protein